jgi:hypothetical protein
LYRFEATLASLGTGVGACSTENSRLMAKSDIQVPLELDLTQAETSREEANKQRNPGSDLPHSCRESNLGCTAHSHSAQITTEWHFCEVQPLHRRRGALNLKVL